MRCAEAWKRSAAGQRNDKLPSAKARGSASERPKKKNPLVRKSAFDQLQHRPTLYWWRLGWMFLGQHRKDVPEFIQQDGRVDACGSDALTSVAGGYQGDSFGVVHR